MAFVRDRCICLRRVEFSETSQVLHLLTRDHGQVHVIAKGAHRRTKAGHSKFDGGLDLLDGGEGGFPYDPPKEMGSLAEWSQRDGRLELRASLRAMNLGQYAAELVGALVEQGDPVPQIFDALQQILDDLATPKIEEAFVTFQLDLLRETGFLPELTGCVACGRAILEREPVVYFSPPRGGVLCRECEPGGTGAFRLDLRVLRLIQNLLKLPRSAGVVQRLPRLTRAQTDPINRLLAEHVEYVLGKRLRLPRWIVASKP